ncbi:Putative peptide permease protein BMEII0860 [Geodia barretti]|uniref:Peptide permease protein BMEII0860 n=1 Tax=Geodia barretti TaxID=519541 RepID=A0AA35RCN7_GEOBA|nr:Putative peptide permease protein BMEII0860 [Geodia barretti]
MPGAPGLTHALAGHKVTACSLTAFAGLWWTPVLLLIVSFFVFLLGTYGPGDPVEVRLGHNYTPELAERLRERLGLNDHFFVQYARYVGRAVQGDLGKSLTFQNRDVITLIGPKLLTSAQLNIAGSIIAIGSAYHWAFTLHGDRARGSTLPWCFAR